VKWSRPFLTTQIPRVVSLSSGLAAGLVLIAPFLTLADPGFTYRNAVRPFFYQPSVGATLAIELRFAFFVGSQDSTPLV